MIQGGLRARALVGRHFRVLVLGVVLAVLLGGIVTYSAYGQEKTRTESRTETVSTWQSTGTFAHEATVTDGTRAFPEGTVLENRTTYFSPISPRLNGSFVYNYTASENGSISTTTTLDLVVRSVDRSPDGDPTEYWRFEESLDTASERLGPGDSLRVRFSRNISAIDQQVSRIEEQIGGSPGTTEAIFVATVSLDGSRNGRSVNRTRTYRLPVTFQRTLYRVNDSGPAIDGGRQTGVRTWTETVPAGTLPRVGGPAILGLGIVGLPVLLVGAGRNWFEVSERERAYHSYRTDRTEFDEWITQARVPTERLEAVDTHIETTSLAGLVDLAIDCDRRVIEAPESDRYLVLDGEVVYRYDAPQLPAGDDQLGPASATVPSERLGSEDADQSAACDTDEAKTTEGSSDGTESETSDPDSSDSLFGRLQKGEIFGDDETRSEDGDDAARDGQPPDTDADETARPDDEKDEAQSS